jgi:hypothetical protein
VPRADREVESRQVRTAGVAVGVSVPFRLGRRPLRRECSMSDSFYGSGTGGRVALILGRDPSGLSAAIAP